MNIHQLQITYSNQEDRLILRINSQERDEMRLFLTQRIMILFWDILIQSINHYTQQQTLNNAKEPAVNLAPKVEEIQQQIQHQNIIDQSDYKTPFNDGNKFPAGESPILVEKITINNLANNTSTLIFSSGDGQNISLNLNQQLLHNLSNLIIKVIPSTNWDIGLMDKANALIPENRDKLALH